MKKNIIIIGHGDLGNRLTRILNDEYKVFHISRNNKYESSNFIQWDWLSKEELNINAKKIDSVIFFPKSKIEKLRLTMIQGIAQPWVINLKMK